MPHDQRDATARKLVLVGAPAPDPLAGLYLGPATVVSAAASRLEVELDDGARVRATTAFSQPYEPAIGDVLLVAGKGDDRYAIGVLRGSGRHSLAVEGDLDVTASGKLRLHGREGVAIEGAEVGIHGDKLKVVARAATEVFQSLATRVAGLWSSHAKSAHTLVEGDAVTQAKNATILTEDNVVVNGKKLFLG